MRRIFATSLFVVLFPGLALCQTQEQAYLRVHSNLPEALLLVDSAYVGIAQSGGVFAVTPGDHSVALSPEEVGSWIPHAPSQDVHLSPGDTVDVVLDFQTSYRIDSVPFGANVYREDEDLLLGKTPLVFSSDTPLDVAFILEKSGYVTGRIVAGKDVANRHSIFLQPVDPEAVHTDAIEWQPPGSRNRWLSYAALGMIVSGGALAVHYKFKADERYEEYLVTGDPATKDRVDQLDRYSYAALGGMQVGVGILVYRLAF